MCGLMVRSSFEEDKFKLLRDDPHKTNNNAKGGNISKNIDKHAPIIHLQLDLPLTCSLLTDKFTIKQLYNLYPFKK